MLPLQLLDRNNPIYARVASLPHLSSATRTKGRKDLVGTYFVVNSYRHRRNLSSLLGRVATLISCEPSPQSETRSLTRAPGY